VIQLHCGNSLDVLATLGSNSVDSIVTDPPYGLSFMGKGWDYQVPSVQIWEQCLRVLKPGGHLLAFAGTRTQHRMAVNIEDAGFEIRDMIAWAYGSGFPKSRNVGDGWGTALKPALEPITVARKPFKGTVANNVLKHGTGAMNIDGCRVAHNEPIKIMKAQDGGNKVYGQSGRHEETTELKAAGRWPANLIHDGSEEVTQLFPQTVGGGVLDTANIKAENNIFGERPKNRNQVHQRDSGSAARFFYCAKANKKDREDGNTHPTVKPTDLMAYLCRLVTPPGGIILDPFMGSGSTGKAAVREGFSFIGIDKEEEYVTIASKRLHVIQRSILASPSADQNG
jgi:site-specific DNA-methyltransferase (adenine-specific)